MTKETNQPTLCAACVEAVGAQEANEAVYLTTAPHFASEPMCHECYETLAYSNGYPNNYKADYLGVLGD